MIDKCAHQLASITMRIQELKDEPVERIRYELINLLTALDVVTEEEHRQVRDWIDNRGYALDIGIHPDLLMLEYQLALQKKIKLQEEEYHRYELRNMGENIYNLTREYEEGKISTESFSSQAVKNAARFEELVKGPVVQEPLTNKKIDEYETKDTVPIRLLNLKAQHGTVIYIGGRPGNGKTLLKLNIARELILRGHQVEFFTYEESAIKLYFKLLLSYYFSRHRESLMNFGFEYERDRPWGKCASPLESLISGIPGEKYPPEYLREERELTREWIESDRLKIYDRPGDCNRLAALLEENPEAVAFLDYIQKVPAENQAANRQVQIQSVSALLHDTMVGANKVLISGAQLNRMNERAPATGPEQDYPDMSGYTLERFREAGDLEQDANIALVIKSERFDNRLRKCSVKVLKNRDYDSNFTTNLDHFSLFWYVERVRNDQAKDISKPEETKGGEGLL